jgi:type I restriction enzyme S subunit
LEKIKTEKEAIVKAGKIKRDKHESFIFRGDDNRYYEQIDGKTADITSEIPFDLPKSWTWARLSTLCDYGVCKSELPEDISADAWVLDLEDIEKDSGTLLVRVSKKERLPTSSKHRFFAGNVLYSKLRTYLNKVLVADINGFCTSEILPLDFGEHIFPEYARCVLMSKMFLDYTAQCGYGVKMPRLGTEDGRKALFPLPSEAEQQRIVETIQQYRQIIQVAQA